MMTGVISIKMHNEWRRWIGLCDELKRLGVDVNAEDDLVRRIKTWGDALVALREEQATEG
jgi:hypothetical protein